jgi:hypothetical protein
MMGGARRTGPVVSVLTITHDRPRELRRAMASVEHQSVPTEHIVIGNGCSHLARPGAIAALCRAYPGAAIDNVTADRDEPYLPARLGQLRNTGARLARGLYIAHLDDDNWFAPDHLERMLRTMAGDPHRRAAHSWRTLVDDVGARVRLVDESPWAASRAEARAAFRYLAAAGVFEEGSAVVRDRMIAPDGTAICHVDTSELLLERHLQLAVPFRERFSPSEQERRLGDDRALCKDLLAASVPVACSEAPTVYYRLGGHSTPGG